MGAAGKRFRAQSLASICQLQLPGYPVGLQRRHDKGKPDASPGRKATGPSRAAELPNVDRPTLRDRRPRSAAEPATVSPRTEDRGSDQEQPFLICPPDRGRFRPAPGRFPPRRGGARTGPARSSSSHASYRPHAASTAPPPGAGQRCVTGLLRLGPPRIHGTLAARRLRPGAALGGRRPCGDTDALCEEERILGRRGDGVLGCRCKGVVRRREVGDPSVASAPRSGGFRRSGRKGVGRDLIAPDCVPGEPSWFETGSPGRARIREGPGPLSCADGSPPVRRACRPRERGSGPAGARSAGCGSCRPATRRAR